MFWCFSQPTKDDAAVRMSSSFQLCLVRVALCTEGCSSKACWVTVPLFLENKLKGLSYVALPPLFPVSYYFRPGSDGVRPGYPARRRWGGGEGVGDRKAFHQAGKLKKHFSYQTLADLSPTPSVCAFLIFLFFPAFSSTFFFFFLPPHSCWNRVMFDQRLHLSSDLC